MPEQKLKRLAIDLTEDEHARLVSHARASGKTLSNWVRKMVGLRMVAWGRPRGLKARRGEEGRGDV